MKAPGRSGTRRWRLATALVAAVAARHAIGAARLQRTLTDLAAAPTSPPVPPVPTGSVRVDFVIPVLHEQDHLAPALRHFATVLRAEPTATLTIVTTSREDAERIQLARSDTCKRGGRRWSAGPERGGGRRSARASGGTLSPPALTRHTLADLLINPAFAQLPIHHTHYVGEGRKAAQVNWAVATLPNRGAGGYIAVYDIDSRPTPAHVRQTLELIDRGGAPGDGPPPVLQHSARFTTAGASARGWERALCRGAARMQTLWTLRREIPGLRRYTRSARKGHHSLPAALLGGGLAQTVGHGLWVRRDVFDALQGLPTHTLLDDLPFGYRLTALRIPVEPLPFLTTAAAPDDARTLIAQGRRWFHNYLDYPSCAAEAARSGHGTLLGRCAALAVACYRGAAWLSSGPATAACVVLAARRSPWPTRLAAASALWLGVVYPVSRLAAFEGRPLSPLQRARQCTEVVGAYLLGSVGPAAAVADHLVRGRHHADQVAPKTMRRSPLP